MVFQSYAIWPHMTVFENVAFPLRHKKPKPTAREIKRTRQQGAGAGPSRTGSRTGRRPISRAASSSALALARALVAEPRVLLLDEPLSNLDAKLREEMRLEIREVVERLGVTTLFVTHEQIEALTMSDVMAVMKDGRIVQEGTPGRDLSPSPHGAVRRRLHRQDQFPQRQGCGGCRRRGAATGRRRHGDRHPGLLRRFRDRRRRRGHAHGAAGERCARLEGAAGVNGVSGRVESIVYVGNMLDCVVAVASERIRVQLHPSVALVRGADVSLHLPVEHCLAMRR